MKERLFIIGGSGFIGKNLVRCLHDKYEISVYDKFIDEVYFAGYQDVKTFMMELDKDKISAEIETPDYIVNLASIVTAERDLSLFDSMIASNLKVLLNLYERFKEDSKLKLFIQFGSSEEYGNEGSPFEETVREEPNSPYALIKQLTTNTAMMLHRNYGFPIAVVRPGHLFGSLQVKTKFIPYVISQLKENKPLNVTCCEQKRDMLFIDDFCWCMSELLRHSDRCKGEIVNVSSGDSIELKRIIEVAKEYLHSTSEVHYGALPYRENEVMDLRCSVEKLSALIGKPISFDITEKIKEYIDIVKKQSI